MRIISGIYGSRIIKAPQTVTRPTTDRMRESLFSKLQNTIEFNNAYILDLFAGSGALGLESISLGAKYCLFNDVFSKSRQIINENCKSLEIAQNCYNVVNFDALKKNSFIKIAQIIPNTFDLVFLDPPYSFDELKVNQIINNLLENALINQNSLIVLESAKGFDFSKNGQINEEFIKTYGNSVIQLLKIA